MHDCDYCEASFDEQEAYLAHLAEDHEGELGPIEQRRVGDLADDDGGLPTGPLLLAGLILSALALVAYILTIAGGGGGTTVNGIQVDQSPDAYRSAHVHGTMNVTIEGERIDFGRDRYQLQADRFHFENRNGRVWHAHATGVTLEYAMATLGIGVTDDSVTYQGRTYEDGAGADVIVAVNGRSVDPETYVLEGVRSDTGEGGDSVRIAVRTTG